MAETKLHYLPKSYKGRCAKGTQDVDFYSTFVSIPSMEIESGKTKKGKDGVDRPVMKKVKLSKDADVHRYELRLPIPRIVADETIELFNLTAEQFSREAVTKLCTSIDEAAKAAMIKEAGIMHPDEAGEKITDAVHLAGQKTFDDWRYTPKAAAKSASVAEWVNKLLARGVITQAQADEIETKDQLFALMDSLPIGK